MKKILLTAITAISVLGAHAQTKSTGVVTLTTGLTAKLDLDSSSSTATLTLTGPSDRWFALQFGSFGEFGGMQNGEDLVYYNGTTLVDAHQNGIGAAPSADTNNWTVSSNTTSGSTRTIIATRAFAGGNGDYTFVYNNADIDFAWARAAGASYTMNNHGGANRGYRVSQPLSAVASVEEVSLKSLKAYPNPVTGILTLSAQTGLSKITVNNLLGQEVLSHNVTGTSAEVNLLGLMAGTYIVQAVAENGATNAIRIVKE